MADEVGSAALQSGQKIIEVGAELIKLLAPLLEKMLKELYRNSVDSINQIGGSIAERLAKGTVTNGELLYEANKAECGISTTSNILSADAKAFAAKAKEYKIPVAVVGKGDKQTIEFLDRDKGIVNQITQEIMQERLKEAPQSVKCFNISANNVTAMKAAFEEQGLSCQFMKSADGKIKCVYPAENAEQVAVVKEDYKRVHGEISDDLDIRSDDKGIVIADDKLGKSFEYSPMNKAQSYGFLNWALTAYFMSFLKTATAELLLKLVVPLLTGMALATVGIFIGFVFPAVLPHSPSMHKGYDLYNAAIPIGLIAFFLRSLLYKVFLPAPPASEGVGLGDSFPVLSFVFCGVVFGLAIIWGLAMGGGKEYGKLLRDSGYNVDYGTKYGSGASVLNFGIYGLFIVLYYVLIGAKWNAATLGCVFCMVCCCYKGSHPANVWPIMVGYVAASYIAEFGCGLTGAEHTLMANAQAIVIGLCFANGLSPVTGVYGWLAGVLFGMIHYTFVTCVPLLHGAFCLYNGGFTAAFTCFLFIPVLEHFCKTKKERRELRARK